MNGSQKAEDTTGNALQENVDVLVGMPITDSKDSSHLKLPLCVLTNDVFFSGDSFEPRHFNAWYRKNGFFPPYHGTFYLFELSWIATIKYHDTMFEIVSFILHLSIWLFVAFVYFAFFLRMIPNSTAQTALYAVSGVISFVQLSAMTVTVSIDAQDPKVTSAGKQRNVAYKKETGVPVIDSDTRFCNICQVVVGPLTKHCKPCNKCVDAYDHHCVYLSTCIGRRNYSPFLLTLILGELLLDIILAISLYVFSMYFWNKQGFVDGVNSIFIEPASSVALVTLTGIFIVLVIAMIVPVTNLLVFHLRICYIGMTTAEYLERRRNREPPLWMIDSSLFKKDPLAYPEVDRGHGCWSCLS